MIVVLLIVSCLLTIVSLYINKKDLVSPAFLFCAAFTFAIAWATVYADKWGFTLHMNTFWVIAGGLLEFVLVSAAVRWFMAKTHTNQITNTKQELIYLQIPIIVKCLIIAFEVLIVAATLFGIMRIMAADWFSLMSAITEYRDAMLFLGEEMQTLPTWVGLGRLFVLALGYWFLYVFINNWIIKRNDYLSLIISILAMLSSMTLGSRGDAFFMVVSAVVLYVVLKNKQQGFRKAIKLRTIIVILLIGIIALLSFKWTAVAIGRVADFELGEYIAIYCGAEIMNLDTFMQEVHYPTRIFGGQTFINMVLWLGPYFGINTEGYTLELPFRWANGYNMGNVYTTFYPYIYDFGIIGLVVLVGLMAFLVQWNYERVKRSKIGEKPRLSILVYEYMSACIVFSFFSNKFYEVMFTQNFVRIVILWLFCNWFCCSFVHRIRIGGRRLL